MKKIIVTTDFSTNSKSGVRFAKQLQSQTKCELVFYHAVQIMKPTSWNNIQYKEFSANKIEEKTAELKKFISDTLTVNASRLKNCSFVVEIGMNLSEMVIARAKKLKADYICTATRGAGKIAKIMGTNTSQLITSSPIPVIAVPKSYRPKPISNIFYASDFAMLSRELKIINAFASTLKLKVDVFHYDYLLHVSENVAKLEKMVARHKAPHLSFHFKKQEIEKPLSLHLKQEVEKQKPSLVVLFTKQNRNWFDRLFLSSEAADMSFDTKVPLLIFRKAEK